MRHVLIVGLLLSTLTCFAQTRPNPRVDVANVPAVRSYANVEELAQSEGYEYFMGSRNSLVVTGTLSAATATELKYTIAGGLASYASPPGVVALHTMRYRFSHKVEGNYYTPANPGGIFNTYTNTQVFFDAQANESLQRPFHQLTYPGQSPAAAALTAAYVPYSGAAPAIGSTTSLTISYSAGFFGNYVWDANIGASKAVDIWGDSIWNGVGPTDWRNMFAFLLREYWTDKGYNYRIRNRSISGSSSLDHVNYMKAGRVYYDAPAAVVIAVGTNDPDAMSTSDNILYLVNKALSMYTTPTNRVRVIVTGILPKLNTTQEATTVTKRAAIKAALEAHPRYGSQVFYVHSLTTAWTPTDATKYLAGDGANGVHPVDAAELTAWGLLKTYLDTVPAFFSGK